MQNFWQRHLAFAQMPTYSLPSQVTISHGVSMDIHQIPFGVGILHVRNRCRDDNLRGPCKDRTSMPALHLENITIARRCRSHMASVALRGRNSTSLLQDLLYTGSARLGKCCRACTRLEIRTVRASPYLPRVNPSTSAVLAVITAFVSATHQSFAFY